VYIVDCTCSALEGALVDGRIVLRAPAVHAPLRHDRDAPTHHRTCSHARTLPAWSSGDGGAGVGVGEEDALSHVMGARAGEVDSARCRHPCCLRHGCLDCPQRLLHARAVVAVLALGIVDKKYAPGPAGRGCWARKRRHPRPPACACSCCSDLLGRLASWVVADARDAARRKLSFVPWVSPARQSAFQGAPSRGPTPSGSRTCRVRLAQCLAGFGSVCVADSPISVSH
jgi:hypothetical protein